MNKSYLIIKINILIIKYYLKYSKIILNEYLKFLNQY